MTTPWQRIKQRHRQQDAAAKQTPVELIEVCINRIDETSCSAKEAYDHFMRNPTIRAKYVAQCNAETNRLIDELVASGMRRNRAEAKVRNEHRYLFGDFSL